MELKGNTADRWEQISTKLAKLSAELEEKKQSIKDAASMLTQIEKDVSSIQSTIEELSNVTYKEVLREESGTLNDEVPDFEDAKDDAEEKAVDEGDNAESKDSEPVIDNAVQPELPLDNKE